MIGLVARRIGEQRDEGAYAILYAIVLVVILAIAALVIDVGFVRAARRENRAASDAAAIVGAGKLGLGGNNPIAACQSAMRYAETSLGVTTPGSDNCTSVFTGSPSALCTLGVAKTASETVAGRTIYVTWPVPDTSTYITTPDLEKWAGVPQSQPAQTIDGSACLRVGVAIQQATNTLFGTGLGFGGTQGTESRSVALSVPAPGPGEVAAPLVVLDQHACQALNATGGAGGSSGGVVVNASAPLSDGSQTPGVIAVDSDGAGGTGENGTSCSGNGATISVSNNSKVWALDGTTGFGYIIDFALTVNNTAHAYLGTTTGCPAAGSWVPPAAPPPNLCRIPQIGERVTDLPWLNRYDCGSTLYTRYTPAGFTCTERPAPALPYPKPRNYVDQWQLFAQNVVSTGAFPSGTTGKIPGTVLTPGGPQAVGSCTINSDLIVVSNVLITCGTLHVKNSAHVSFKGMVVASGNVSVENSACVMLNDIVVADCAIRPAPVSAALPPPDGQNVYIGGTLSIASGASFVDSQSFVFLTGQLQSNGGAQAGSVVSWVAPYAPTDDTGCVPAAGVTSAPTSGCFNSLAMWSPYQGINTGGSQDFLTGGGNLNVDGTLFMGYSAFNFAGQAANIQARAQFVSRLLLISGGGLLNMTPDGSRSTTIPAGAGQLIR